MRLRASSCVRTPVGFVLACPGLIWASSGGLTSARLRLRLRARFGAFLESKTKIPLDLFACSTDSDSSGDRIISSQAFRAFLSHHDDDDNDDSNPFNDAGTLRRFLHLPHRDMSQRGVFNPQPKSVHSSSRCQLEMILPHAQKETECVVLDIDRSEDHSAAARSLDRHVRLGPFFPQFQLSTPKGCSSWTKSIIPLFQVSFKPVSIHIPYQSYTAHRKQNRKGKSIPQSTKLPPQVLINPKEDEPQERSNHKSVSIREVSMKVAHTKYRSKNLNSASTAIYKQQQNKRNNTEGK